MQNTQIQNYQKLHCAYSTSKLSVLLEEKPLNPSIDIDTSGPKEHKKREKMSTRRK